MLWERVTTEEQKLHMWYFSVATRRNFKTKFSEWRNEQQTANIKHWHGLHNCRLRWRERVDRMQEGRIRTEWWYFKIQILSFKPWQRLVWYASDARYAPPNLEPVTRNSPTWKQQGACHMLVRRSVGQWDTRWMLARPPYHGQQAQWRPSTETSDSLIRNTFYRALHKSISTTLRIKNESVRYFSVLYSSINSFFLPFYLSVFLSLFFSFTIFSFSILPRCAFSWQDYRDAQKSTQEKVNVKFPLDLIKHHAMKTCEERWSTAPRNFNTADRWRWVVSFTHRPLYPQGKSSMTTGQGVEWAREPVWSVTKSLPLLGIKHP